MNVSYSFLKDELALEEIRKHKWIESEKHNREIGFATAAVDWIKKYGEKWKQFRFGLAVDSNIFAERRTYRRFLCRIPVRLKVNDTYISSCINDLNWVGFSCVSPQYIPEHTPIEVTFDLHDRGSAEIKANFQFESRVRRISPPRKKAQYEYHEIFFPFSERVKNYLRENVGILA